MNGFVMDVASASQLPNLMAQEIFRQRRQIQEWVMKGELSDAIPNIYEWLLRQDSFASYNGAIFPSSSRPEKYTQGFVAASVAPAGPFFSAPDCAYFSSLILSAWYELVYSYSSLSPTASDSIKTITHVVPVSLARPHQVNMAIDAISRVLVTMDARLYIWNCDASSQLTPAKVIRALVRSSPDAASPYVSMRVAEISIVLLGEFTRGSQVSVNTLVDAVRLEDDTSVVDVAKFEEFLRDAAFESAALAKEAASCTSVLQDYDPSHFQLISSGRVRVATLQRLSSPLCR
jgi:hypothetical protein